MAQKEKILQGQQRLMECLKELNCQKDELCPLEKLWDTYERRFLVKFDIKESKKYFGEPDVIMALQRFMCGEIDFALKLDDNHKVLRFIVAKNDYKHEDSDKDSKAVKTPSPEKDLKAFKTTNPEKDPKGFRIPNPGKYSKVFKTADPKAVRIPNSEKDPKAFKIPGPEKDPKALRTSVTDIVPEGVVIPENYGKLPTLRNEKRAFLPPEKAAPKVPRPPAYTVDDLSNGLAGFKL